MSGHGHQLGEQVRSGDAGVCGVDWESFHQRCTWKSVVTGFTGQFRDNQSSESVAGGQNM